MHVVVAEKPSVARDIARVLGASRRRDGYLECPDGSWAVTWALGHLCELKMPDEYDPALKRWSLATLPFVPERFELKPSGDRSARAQREVVERLCREADELVCATDAGREGELIFRYLLEIAGVPRRPFTRLWLSSLTDEAIRAGFAARKPGSEYESLHDAARSRSEADWIVGLNATRAYTVRYGGGKVLWTLGRVQTPVLAMVAARDDEIRTFESKPFFELRTVYRGTRFVHVPAADAGAAADRKGAAGAAAASQAARFDDRATAEAALARVQDRPFVVDAVRGKRENRPPPPLYDLTQLQRDMNLRHGLSAQRTLEIAQQLYEKKVLTYPRTDSRHLPSDMRGGVAATLAALGGSRRDPAVADAVAGLDLAKLPMGKRIFDDARVTDHHAIVPIAKAGAEPGRGLDVDQARVFDAVVRRFVQVFLPDLVRDVTVVEGSSGGLGFRARGVVVVEPGWTVLEPARKKRTRKGADGEEDDDQKLPAFEKGESGPHEPFLHEGRTEPPRPYTENTLLLAMETAGRGIEDEALRDAMRSRGLGTPATRASIVETLLSRSYLRREKKALRITDLGRYLIAILREPRLKSPELTGDWEYQLGEVERGRAGRQEFMAAIREYTAGIVGTVSPEPLPDGLGPCPKCGRPVIEGRRAFGCSGFAEGCVFVLPKTYRGLELSHAQVRELLGRGLVMRPVPALPEDEGAGPRILCLAAGGRGVIDLAVPDREAQRGRSKAAAGRGPRGGSVGGRPQRAGVRAGGGKGGGARSAGGGSAGRGVDPARRTRPDRKSGELPPCPLCRRPMTTGNRGFGCTGWREGCRFVVWKQIAGKSIRISTVRTLVEKGRTSVLKGFRDRTGREVSGRLVLEGGEVRVEFEAGS